MFKKRRKPSLEPLNTTSTADISFILLVFFLVITSMDTDKGLPRQLPPPDDNRKQEIVDVKKNNLMTLTLTAKDTLLADGKTVDVTHLDNGIIEFISKKADRRQHIIYIDIDSRSSYGAYFKVQNQITAAYNTLRNRFTSRKYGKPYSRCTTEEREDARTFYPQRVVENIKDTMKGTPE